MPDNVTAIYDDSDNLLRVSNLHDQRLDAVLAAGTCQVWVYNIDGTEVAGPTWPLSFDNEGLGVYEIILPDTMVLSPPGFVNIKVVMDGGAPDLKRTKVFKHVPVKEA